MIDLRFKKAKQALCEVLMFEHWIRFYFVKEKESKLSIDIPDEAMAYIRESHGHLTELAEKLNHAEIDYQSSRKTVCNFVGEKLDGAQFGADIVPKVLDDGDFKIEMYLFGLWLKGHETYLDEQTRPFCEWTEMFEGWRGMDEVQAYRTKLVTSRVKDGTGAGKVH